MDNLLQLNSVTQAMRARDILRKNGIGAEVQRIPARKGRGVCSYGLRIKNNLNEAVKILRENDIKFTGRVVGDLR